MSRRPQDSWSGLAPPLSAFVFVVFVATGCAYIVFAKLFALPLLAVTLVPVAIMLTYAGAAFLVREIRLRDDQTGDNLYYMGFLFTLTSLGVALYQFDSFGGVESIVRNFGIAITSTIAGIALRVFFNQMRRDPAEVERAARLELADAARRVRRELDGTVLELKQFRRATQQSIREAYEEIQAHVGKAGQGLVGEVGKLSARTGEVAAALYEVTAKLKAMQLPEEIIALKLSPVSKAFAASVEAFGMKTGEQAAELTKVLEKLYELEKGREAATVRLDGAIPSLELARRSMEGVVPRIDALAAEIRRRADEAEAKKRTEEGAL